MDTARLYLADEWRQRARLDLSDAQRADLAGLRKEVDAETEKMKAMPQEPAQRAEGLKINKLWPLSFFVSLAG